MSALRAALAHFIDYAGLFPPAALDLQTTVANHDRYARSSEGWMLGRLVVPLSRSTRSPQLLARLPATERNWTIAVLVGAGDPIESVPAAIDRFTHRREQRASPSARWRRRRPAWMHCPAVPDHHVTLERFVEVPLDATRDTWLDALAGVGCMPRSRTGGLTADRFPSPASLASLLAACAQPRPAAQGHGWPAPRDARCVPAHLRTGSPSGVMHGFVNLLVAALILRTGAGTAADAQRALEVHDPREFTLDEDAISWEGHAFSAAACADTRAHLLRSVGSCSFEEPVADLRGLDGCLGIVVRVRRD